MMRTARRATCPAPRTSALVAWACAALVLAGVAASADNLRVFAVQPDFAAYYLASRAGARGESMYSDAVRARLAHDLDLPAGAYTGSTWYLYPPALAVALRPLAALPFGQAALVWLVLNAWLTALAVYYLLRLFRWPPPRAVLGAAGALLLPGTQQTLMHGQVNWLPLAAAVFCIRDWSRAQGQAGSILLGAAAALKPFTAVLWAAAPRGLRTRAALVAALGGALVLGWSWWAYGSAFLDEWPRALFAHSARSFAGDGSNQALAAVVARMAPAVPAVSVRTASGLIFFVTIAMALAAPASHPRRIDIGLRVGTLTAAALMVLPLAWDHYHLLLIAPAVVFLYAARRAPGPWGLFVAGALLLVVHRFWRPLFATVPSDALLALGFIGTALWWASGAWLLARRPRAGRVMHV